MWSASRLYSLNSAGVKGGSFVSGFEDEEAASGLTSGAESSTFGTAVSSAIPLASGAASFSLSEAIAKVCCKRGFAQVGGGTATGRVARQTAPAGRAKRSGALGPASGTVPAVVVLNAPRIRSDLNGAKTRIGKQNGSEIEYEMNRFETSETLTEANIHLILSCNGENSPTISQLLQIATCCRMSFERHQKGSRARISTCAATLTVRGFRAGTVRCHGNFFSRVVRTSKVETLLDRQH